jgi:hypothetical protein
VVNIEYSNVTIGKSQQNNQIVVKGDITNRSGRHYNAVASRIVLFIKNIPIANTVVVVNGLQNGATKSFEKYIEELDFEQVGKDINRFDVYAESAY